jgi:hypothetical protein
MGSASVHRLSLPERFNQGQAVPGYLLCDDSILESVELEFDEGLELVEAFNVGEREDSKLGAVFKPETPSGYVGFTVRADIAAETTVTKGVRAIARCKKHGITRHTWTGQAYRPLLKLSDAPATIQLAKKEERWQADRRIRLDNVGSSIAVVSVSADDGSELPVEISSDFLVFVKGFVRDLTARMPTLAESYPTYRDLLEEFPRLFTYDKKTQTMDRIKELDDYLARLAEATAKDETFENDLGGAVAIAFRANWRVANLADQFVEAMKATQGKKVILRNPFDSLKLSPQTKSIRLRLHIADMATNRYDPIEIGPVSVKATEETEIPVYKILQFGDR